MKIKISNNEIDTLTFRDRKYPIKENMYIKINNYKIKGLHDIKIFLEGILASNNYNEFEIGYLGEENK